MTDEQQVIVDHRGSHVVLTLNRPDKLNALNAAVLLALDDALAVVENDVALRAVVLHGAGERAFCAGADLGELRGLDAAGAAATLGRGQRVLGRLASLDVPVIAAVNGHAVGGGFELALASTFVLASTNATFSLPETGLGLIPGYGGTQRLARLIGRQRAGYLITTGRRLSSEEAWEAGLLCEKPVPSQELLDRATALAGEVAGKGRLATTAALRLLAATESGMAAGLVHETTAAALVTSSAEADERVTAFLDRAASRAG